MDTRLRLYSRRAAAMNGGPNDEALLLMERVRCGEIEHQHLMLAAAAGIPAVSMVLGITLVDTVRNFLSGDFLSPNPDLFEPIVEQVKVVWELNNRLRWGFTASDFALPIPTNWSAGGEQNFKAVILVPYLDTVGETFEALWHAIEARHANNWRWDGLRSDLTDLKLLDGIVHPGRCLRWETIDLAANWDQENGIRPCEVRNAQSPHAGILAAAAIHTKWVEAMDGETVPYVWLPGYQYFFDGRWSVVPWLDFAQVARLVRLFRRSDGHHLRSFAVPGPVGE